MIALGMLCVALLAACSTEEPLPQQDPAETPEATRGETAAATPADRSFEKAQAFAAPAQFDSAAFYFEQAGRLYEEDQNWEGYVRCYNMLGQIARQQGRFGQAMEHLQHALETGRARLGETHAQVATSYGQIGIVHAIGGNYDEAVALWNKALPVQRAVYGDEHPNLATLYNNLGNVAGTKGDYARALDHYDKAASIWSAAQGEQHPSVARSYNNMGVIYGKQGDYTRALDHFNKAASIWIAAQGEQHPEVARNYQNMGVIYRNNNDHEQALTYYQKALAIRQATGGEQHPQVAQLYNNIGTVYLEQGAYQEALAYYQKSLTLKQATLGPQHPNVVETYGNIGDVYHRQGDYQQALAFYNKALPIAQAAFGPQHPDVAGTYNRIGAAFRDSGQYEAALEVYRQAFSANRLEGATSDSVLNPPLEGVLDDDVLLESLRQQAQTLTARYAAPPHRRADLEAALATYRHAARLLDQMRSSYKAEGSKLYWAEKATDLYDQAVQTALTLYHETGEPAFKETAFLFAEKSKAGILLEALSDAEAKAFAGIPDTLLQQERALRIDLAYYEQSLTRERLKEEKADSARVARWQDKMFDLQQAYQRLAEHLETDYPDYYNLKYQVKTATIETLDQQLDAETALVEYFIGADSIFIFTLAQGAFDVTTAARDSLLEEHVTQLRQGIIEQNYDRYTTHAHRLYQVLLEPVAAITEGRRLIVVPDGILNYLPFETLLTKLPDDEEESLKDYRALAYLIDQHALSYAYSATLLLDLLDKQRPRTPRDFVAFAPVFAEGLPTGTRGAALAEANQASDSTRGLAAGALPASRTEVTGILEHFRGTYGFFEKTFGNRARVYLDQQANEANLKAPDLAAYRYVHLATHGFVNEAAPALSGIVLARDPGSPEDGILHLGEVYTLQLNAELVVLSACESGLGQIARGEGMIGLTRGFLYAGAANVLVSLWQADDTQTADLMMRFYEEMLQQTGKPEALRTAKRALIQQNPRYARPYYWAPFVLIGT